MSNHAKQGPGQDTVKGCYGMKRREFLQSVFGFIGGLLGLKAARAGEGQAKGPFGGGRCTPEILQNMCENGKLLRVFAFSTQACIGLVFLVVDPAPKHIFIKLPTTGVTMRARLWGRQNGILQVRAANRSYIWQITNPELPVSRWTGPVVGYYTLPELLGVESIGQNSPYADSEARAGEGDDNASGK